MSKIAADMQAIGMNLRFKIILTLLVLAAMLVVFLVIPMFVLKR